MTETDESEAVLEVRDLQKYFNNGSGGFLRKLFGDSGSDPIKAVDGISFDLLENEILGVVGESGCGKSTMGKSLLRLIEPTGGDVRFQGESVPELSRTQMRELRQEMQMIFQDPGSALNPQMKVKHLIREPLENFGSHSHDELEARTDELLEQVELPTAVKDRYPHELSGGQQQRVVIARAIALDPEMIVADEPVTGLDVSVQSSILATLNEIQEEFNLSLLFIAHDLAVVRHISDRVMVLYLGGIVELGRSESVFSNPQHPYTRALKQAIPRSHPEGTKQEGAVAEGEPPSPKDPPSGCRFHTRCPAYIGDVCEEEEPEAVELADNRVVSCHHFEAGDKPVPKGENLTGKDEVAADGGCPSACSCPSGGDNDG